MAWILAAPFWCSSSKLLSGQSKDSVHLPLLENGNRKIIPHLEGAIFKEHTPLLPINSMYIAHGNKREKIGILHYCSVRICFAFSSKFISNRNQFYPPFVHIIIKVEMVLSAHIFLLLRKSQNQWKWYNINQSQKSNVKSQMSIQYL